MRQPGFDQPLVVIILGWQSVLRKLLPPLSQATCFRASLPSRPSRQTKFGRRSSAASFRSHRADRPVRRVGRCRTQRSLDHGGHLIVVDGARAARAGFVKQAITAILKTGGATCQRCARGCRVRQPRICLASRPHIARSRGTAQIATAQHGDDGLSLQVRPLLRTQHQRLDRPASHTCIRHKRSPLSERFELSYNVTNLRSR